MFGRLGVRFGRLGASASAVLGPRMVMNTITVAEDATNGTTVGTVSAVGTTGTPTWSEVADPSGKFAINSSTGVVTTTAALDFETAASHSYTVGVSGLTPSLSNTVFTILVTNVVEDTTPAAFSFTDAINADLSTVYTSDAITVTGVDGACDVTVTGGTYSINGGAYTSSAGSAVLNDTITVRGTSSGSYDTAVDVILSVGGNVTSATTDTFRITTIPDPNGGGGGSTPTFYILGF